MSATLDFSTDVGKVRGIIGDTDITIPWLSDANIASNITVCGGTVELAAAMCLDAMAVRASMSTGKVKLLDLEVDGPALSSVLIRLAESIRLNYRHKPDFEIASELNTVFSLRDFYWNEFLQTSGEPL